MSQTIRQPYWLRRCHVQSERHNGIPISSAKPDPWWRRLKHAITVFLKGQ